MNVYHDSALQCSLIHYSTTLTVQQPGKIVSAQWRSHGGARAPPTSIRPGHGNRRDPMRNFFEGGVEISRAKPHVG